MELEVFEKKLEDIKVYIEDLLNNALLKDVPIIKTLKLAIKNTISIDTYLFTKKIEAFLNGAKQNKSFYKKIGKSNKRKKVMERILFIIDKVDTPKKAELIGKTLPLAGEDFTKTEYFRVCHIIDKSFYEDLESLLLIENNEVITIHNHKIEAYIIENLHFNNLLRNVGFDGGSFENEYGGQRFELNEYGTTIKELLKN